MKKNILLGMILLGTMAMGASETVESSVTGIDNVTLSVEQDLEFGNVLVGTGNGQPQTEKAIINIEKSSNKSETLLIGVDPNVVMISNSGAEVEATLNIDGVQGEGGATEEFHWNKGSKSSFEVGGQLANNVEERETYIGTFNTYVEFID